MFLIAGVKQNQKRDWRIRFGGFDNCTKNSFFKNVCDKNRVLVPSFFWR